MSDDAESRLSDKDRARRVLGKLWRKEAVEKEAADKLLKELQEVLKEFGLMCTEVNEPKQRLVNVFQSSDRVTAGYGGGYHDHPIHWGHSERRMNIQGMTNQKWSGLDMAYDYATNSWASPDGRCGLEVLCQGVVDAFKAKED